MAINNNPVSVLFTNSELRILIEEYIIQQKNNFTLKGACSYVLYWAVENSKIAGAESTLIESAELRISDQERIKEIIKSIVADGRIAVTPGSDTKYAIIKC